ncbi:MAG TPA: prolyl oligopeptidase family serine peptidase [Rhodanobacteraceae bacterium]|nr:prolyl oligopeptidase family serine peptidase [Rhodanobacteraceae bacterium]
MKGWSRVIARCLCAVLSLPAGAATVAATDAALQAAVATERARPVAPRLPRAAFLLRQTIAAVTLSPDGSHLAWFEDHADTRSVWTQATRHNAKPRRLLGQTDATTLAWSHDGRWLLLQSPRQLFALATARQAGSGIVATLGGTTQRQVLAVDPTRPAAVLLREHAPARSDRAERWRLLRADVRGQRTLLRESTQKILAAALDSEGRLAFLQQVDGDALRIDRINSDGHAQPVLRCTELHRCDLLPRTDHDGRLLLETDLGASLKRLARLAADGALHTLAIDPTGIADLDSLAIDPVDGTPRIASYRGTVPTNAAVDTALAPALAALTARFPGRNLDIQLAHDDTAPWLVAERDSTLQGVRWHLFDPSRERVRDILDTAPESARGARPAHWIAATALARKIPFDWHASDGMRLHGFVWLPPGRDPATLPLLALVHGGPWNHSHPAEFGAGYSQFLANRGYVVFEPNFRASTGYGRDYLLAAHGDFGNGRVQQDIVDGVRYLLAHGIGDAERVGIAGASFGGYSTLLGVTFQPDLFKVGIAIVPPPDFAWDLEWVSRSSEALNLSSAVPFKDWLRMLNLDLDNRASMARLHAQSPLANSDQMNRPLLIFASGKDRRVALRGVLGYVARLRLEDKDVHLYVDAEAGHKNYTPLSNEAYLYLLASMLHQHLGGAATTPPDPELAAWLQRNRRLAGKSLFDRHGD